MKNIFFTILIFLTFVLFASKSTNACSCVSQTTCEFANSADVIFVGRVKNTKIEERLYRYSEGPYESPVKAKFQISRLQIKESFRGIENEKEISIETDNYSSCFFSLQKGVSYIVYANKDSKTGNLSAGFCSGTKSIGAGIKDIIYLRSQKNVIGSSVQGFVGFNAKSEDHLYLPQKNNYASISKIGIFKVLLEDDSKNYFAKIGRDSRYEFQNVLKGKYKLSVVLPEGYRTLNDYNPEVAKELGIESGTIDVTGFGCTVNNFTVVKNK